jgi:chloride channel protein, CIC family
VNRETEASNDRVHREGSLSVLALLSLLVGAASGAIGAAFRLALTRVDQLRNGLLAWSHGETIVGLPLVLVFCAASAGIAAWLVRRYFAQAIGSGIPHVEAVLKGELPAAPLRLIPVKFFGGLLAIGGGLALGREGPSVQMGATVAHLLGRVFKCNGEDCKTLLAAGAGAGLATAFNAPIAGAVFVLEELVRRFDSRVMIATVGASASAIAVARLLFGETPDFHVEPLPYLGFGTVPLHLVLGVVAGFVGIAYNRAILGCLAASSRVGGWPVELRAGLVGILVGTLAWVEPKLVGGGDVITQRTLEGTDALGMVSIVFLVRFVLGPVSYAARTPGGLFAPMLVLGAQLGMVFGTLCCRHFPGMATCPVADACIGMAAFFTAVVRAPVTGIILAIELTGSFTLLLPMLSACFTAMLVPTLLGNPPIYDSLSSPP